MKDFKSEIPEFLNRKGFSNYYLFSDSEIILNKDFSKKVKLFSKSINVDSITIELILTQEFESIIKNKIINIPIIEDFSFDKFYDLEINYNNNNFSYYMFDFFIYDKTKDWELFCSMTQEMAIFGCNENVRLNFIEMINPYKEYSLVEKLKMIRGDIINKDDRIKYIQTLTSKFNFCF